MSGTRQSSPDALLQQGIQLDQAGQHDAGRGLVSSNPRTATGSRLFVAYTGRFQLQCAVSDRVGVEGEVSRCIRAIAPAEHLVLANKDSPAVLQRITAYLEDGSTTIIPYREYRAVMFYSNMFHRSDRFRFKSGYRNSRMNVTMLFGQQASP